MTTDVQTDAGIVQQQTFNLQWRITASGTDPNLRSIDVTGVTFDQDGLAAFRNAALSTTEASEEQDISAEAQRRLAAKARRDESNSTQNGCVRPTNPSEKYSQSHGNREK